MFIPDKFHTYLSLEWAEGKQIKHFKLDITKKGLMLQTNEIHATTYSETENKCL